MPTVSYVVSILNLYCTPYLVSRESLHSCVANNLSHLPHGGSYFRNLTFLLNLYLSIVYDFVSVSTLFAYCEF